MAKSTKQKYYVVWKGNNPGIYTSWTDCQLQIKGYEGALYKSFTSKEEAEEAYNSSAHHYFQSKKKADSTPKANARTLFAGEIIENSLCVDAACSGNPGPMEYRGVYTGNDQQLFHLGPIYGTNNIGEFLAIVHGLALIKQNKWEMSIYTDSKTAMSWIKQRKCKTKLERNQKTATVHDLIERAEKWLNSNSYTTKIYKWDTDRWGEIPADFGRK